MDNRWGSEDDTNPFVIETKTIEPIAYSEVPEYQEATVDHWETPDDPLLKFLYYFGAALMVMAILITLPISAFIILWLGFKDGNKGIRSPRQSATVASTADVGWLQGKS